MPGERDVPPPCPARGANARPLTDIGAIDCPAAPRRPKLTGYNGHCRSAFPRCDAQDALPHPIVQPTIPDSDYSSLIRDVREAVGSP